MDENAIHFTTNPLNAYVPVISEGRVRKRTPIILNLKVKDGSAVSMASATSPIRSICRIR